jgi:hypothetical protein
VQVLSSRRHFVVVVAAGLRMTRVLGRGRCRLRLRLGDEFGGVRGSPIEQWM